MITRICQLLVLNILFCASSFAQPSDIAIHDEVKDSVIVRFNRNDFKGIYQLADPTQFTIPEQNLSGFFLNTKRNSGSIINAIFLADSSCMGCNSKRAKYYLLNFQLRSQMLLLEVLPSKKYSSIGLINYTFPDRTETSAIKTNNPMRDQLDLSVDSAVREYFRNPHATGLSIGIIKNGKRITYHYGETAKGKGKLPSDQTIYELGSVTKTFTSTILANAIIENRVTLQDDIRKYLPGSFPNLEYKGRAITLQDLSTHTSGIPSVPDDFYTNPHFDPLTPWNGYDTTMFWQFLHRAVIDTVPGYKERYSNSGVALLGRILENVYKLSYDELLQKYITQPFRMKHTRTWLIKKDEKNLAAKYSANGNAVPYWQGKAYAPGGVGVFTCMEDMLNYAENQIAETDPAIKRTHQSTVNNSGLGWGIGNVGTAYLKYEHSGGTNGFSTHIRVFPKVKSGLIILANNDVVLSKLIRRLSPLVVE